MKVLNNRLFLPLILAIAAVVAIAVACNNDADDGGDQAIADDGADVITEEVLGPGPSGLRDGLANFDFPTVTWNSYWYSRFNLGSLVMMSGLGVTFMPDMDAVMAMVAAVDQGPEDGEHVQVPENPALLKAVYSRGDPAFTQAFNGNPLDLANWRWDPANVDRTITPSAQAQTIIKEVQWAKFFNSPNWAGTVTDEFGAMDRFKGMVLFTEAKMQAEFALTQMRNSDGLFVAGIEHEGGTTTVVDPTVSISDQFQMLQALTDIHSVLHNPEEFNNVYGDEAFHSVVADAADDLFRAIATLEPQSIQDYSLGAQAAVWYASSTHNAELQQQALTLLADYGDRLVASSPDDVVERARAIRGLVEAGRVTEEANYLAAASSLFQELEDDYNVALGYFESRTRLSVWEVGDIVGAFNTLLRHGDDSIDQKQLQRMFVGFFEAAVNRSGLLQAAPPKEMEASPFELARTGSDLFFAYPSIPSPEEAGGTYGRAPVDATEIAFDEASGRWAVTDASFNTAGAMHASNEQIWVFGIVSGFPTVETR